MFTTEKMYLLLFQLTPSLVSVFVLLALIKFVIPKIIEKTTEKVIEIVFLKKQTEIVEGIKNGFNKSLETFKRDLQEDLQIKVANEIEPMKSSLAKENINFQINYTEFIKRRFTHIEDIYGKLYEIERYISNNYRIKNKEGNNDQKSFEEFYRLKEELTIEAYKSVFFLDEKIEKELIKFIQIAVKTIDIYTSYAKIKKSIEILVQEKSSEEIIAPRMTELNSKRNEYLAARKELVNELENINNQFKRFNYTPSK